MTDAWVVDASPIIVLAKVGLLALLEESGARILVPDAVAREVLAGPESDPGRQAIERGWGERLAPGEVPEPILGWSLGAGESEVLAAAAASPGRVALLDDAQARACAHTLGIPVTGMIGVIVKALRAGGIESAARAIKDLRGAGLFIDDCLVRMVLDRMEARRRASGPHSPA